MIIFIHDFSTMFYSRIQAASWIGWQKVEFFHKHQEPLFYSTPEEIELTIFFGLAPVTFFLIFTL